MKNANKPGRKSKNDNRPKSLADLTPERVVSRKYITSAMRQVTGGDKAHKADQTNPVAEVMNRSRVVVEAGQSGHGSAAKSARWVGDSHFRRLSASESPEGKGIGLDNYLALYARPDRNGFLRVPAYKVKDGRILRKEVDWLTYQDEMRAVIAYADSENESGYLVEQSYQVKDGEDKDGEDVYRTVDGVCKARVHEDGVMATRMVDMESITHIDVAADDVLAVAGSLIPFVLHDDDRASVRLQHLARLGSPDDRPLARHVRNVSLTAGRYQRALVPDAGHRLPCVGACHDGASCVVVLDERYERSSDCQHAVCRHVYVRDGLHVHLSLIHI